MSKPLFTLLFALLACPTAMAQVGDAYHDFCIGAGGGVNISQISFTPKVNQKYHVAPMFGLAMRYTSERYYGMLCAFQAEINFSKVGWVEDIYSQANEKLDDKYQRDLTYISVPILANLGFGRKDLGFKGYLVAGPQVSFLLADKEQRSETWTVKYGGIPDRMNGVTAQYGMKVSNSFEYGITVGLGCEYSSKIGHIMLECRYYMGLSNLFGNAKTDPFAQSGQRTIVAKMTYMTDIFRKRKH